MTETELEELQGKAGNLERNRPRGSGIKTETGRDKETDTKKEALRRLGTGRQPYKGKAQEEAKT